MDDKEGISDEDDVWFEEGIVACGMRNVILMLGQDPQLIEQTGVQDEVMILKHVQGWPKLLPCISSSLEEVADPGDSMDVDEGLGLDRVAEVEEEESQQGEELEGEEGGEEGKEGEEGEEGKEGEEEEAEEREQLDKRVQEKERELQEEDEEREQLEGRVQEEEGQQKQQKVEGEPQKGEIGHMEGDQDESDDMMMSDGSQRQSPSGDREMARITDRDIEMRESSPPAFVASTGLASTSRASINEPRRQLSPLTPIGASEDDEPMPQLQKRTRPAIRHSPEVKSFKRRKIMKVKMPTEIVEVISLKRHWVRVPTCLIKHLIINSKFRQNHSSSPSHKPLLREGR